MKRKVIFIFLDGVGIAPAGDSNPFACLDLPHFESYFNCKITSENTFTKQNCILAGIDACLGIAGLPQSATGQTTLFTGINAAQYLGYHFPAFPDEKLKKLIDKYTLLKQVTDAGLKATFANAYTPNYFSMVEKGKRQHSVTTLSVYAAGLPFRNLDDLNIGNALYWDITNEYLYINYQYNIDMVSPYEAGKNLSKMSQRYDLVIFECFLPDLIGHKRDKIKAEHFINTLDVFFHGLISDINDNTNLIITSDHGNIENIAVSGHTFNPALFIAIGKDVSIFHSINSISQVSGGIMTILRG